MHIIDPLVIKNTVLFSSNVPETDAAAWVAQKTQAVGDLVMEQEPSSVVTISAASPCVVTWAGHGRATDTPVVFTTTGALPAGLVAGEEYYAIATTTNTFELALKAGSTISINTSGAQSGVHTATARVHQLFKSLVGARAVVTITIASPGVVSWVAHGLVADDRVSFSTTGALPSGMAAGQVYFVKSPTTDAFSLAVAAGGAALITTGSQSGVHTATSTAALHFGKQPAIGTAQWANKGKTNRWKMFDELNSSQTEYADVVEVEIQTTGVATGSWVGNVDADTVTWTMTDPVEGVVYTETQSMILSNSGSSFWGWGFNRIKRRRAAATLSLPPYAGAKVEISISKPGGVAKCGLAVVGAVVDGGKSLIGLGTDIKDYSTTTFNSDGTSRTILRGYSKRMSVDVTLRNEESVTLQDELSDYRSKYMVWIGAIEYDSTHLFGRYAGFKNIIDGKKVSKMSLQIEGTV